MRFSYYKRPLFLLLLCWAGGTLIWKYSGISVPPSRPVVPVPGEVRLEGRVAQYPARAGGLWRLPLELPDGVTVMAYVRDTGGASYGDTAELRARLSEPFNYAVPGNLDWRRYLAGRGIRLEARGDDLVVLEKARFPFRQAAGFRTRALEVFEKNFTADHYSVLAGVVLGEKRGVSEELKAAFQDSGAMHLLVASGSNVGFVTFLVFFLGSRLGLRKIYSGPAALAAAGFYVLAAGLEAPLVRGYIMFSAALAGYLLDRDSGAFQGLVLACFAILLAEPRALFDAGFQMSFVASYGITAGMALWDKLIPLSGPARTLARVLMVSFFAQAGLYPLLALYFHKIALISVISNVVLVPASGLVMGLGFFLLAVPGQTAAFSAAKTAAEYGLDGFIRALKFFSSFKYASVAVSPPSAPMMAAGFVFVLVLLHAPLLGFRRRRLYALAALPLSAAALLALLPEKAVIASVADSNTRSVIFRCGGGLLLFNPGLNGKKLANAALHYGRREAEAVFISSLARGDWSGLEEFAGVLKVKRIFLPYGPRPAELASALAGLSAGGIVVERVWPGETVNCGGFEVLSGWKRRGESAEAGYTGRGGREGLDWRLKGAEFEASVEGGGAKVEVRDAEGEERTLESRPGFPSELEI